MASKELDVLFPFENYNPKSKGNCLRPFKEYLFFTGINHLRIKTMMQSKNYENSEATNIRISITAFAL